MKAKEILETAAATIIQRGKADGYDPTDTFIDLIGYTALLAECLTEK